MARQNQNSTNTLRNIRVRVRMSVIEERITMKGAIQKRPGRERQQEKFVKDFPVLEMLVPEYVQRASDLADVMIHGWELATLPPPEAWMGDLILNPLTALLHMSAKVRSNNVVSTCGFYIATNQQFTDEVAYAADQSPVTSADDEYISYVYDVTGLGGTDLYICPFVNDGTKVAYGIIKHIELPTTLP